MTSRLADLIAGLRGGGPGGTLARGTATALTIRVAGLAIALFVQVGLARLLGVVEYGYYTYALSWVIVLSMPAALGFDLSSLRFVAEYRGRQEWALLLGFLRRGGRAAFLSSCAVASIAALAVYTLRDTMAPSQTVTLWLACLVLPVLVQLQIGSASLKAFRRVARAQVPLDIVRPILLIGLALGIRFLTAPPLGAPLAMGAMLAATAVALTVTILLLRSTVAELIPVVAPETRTQEWLSTSFPLLVLSGLFVLLSQTDILMVGIILDTTRAGIYSAASRLASLMLLGVVAVNAIGAPMIAQYSSQGDERRLGRTLRIAAWGKLALAVPTATLLGGAGWWLLGWFGSEFGVAYAAMLILTSGHLIGALCGTSSSLMTMTGHQLPAMKIGIVATALNVTLNALLIPEFGINGAAMATGATTAIWNLTMLLWVIRNQGWNPSLFGRTRLKPQGHRAA